MILNGEPCTVNEEILNLALYGNACFTTMLISNGSVKGLGLHFSRLQRDAVQLFGMDVVPDKILANIKRFLEQTKSGEPLIVRVTIFPAAFNISRPELSENLSILVTGRARAEIDNKKFRVQCIDAERSLPLHKSINMIAGFRARRSARQSGFDDALLTANGLIYEGPTWNVFFVHENTLFTPPISRGVLPGVTRSLLFSCCEKSDFVCQESEIDVGDLTHYTAAFGANASLGIVPIDTIDGYTYSDQKTLSRIQNLYSKIPGDVIIRPR